VQLQVLSRAHGLPCVLCQTRSSSVNNRKCECEWMTIHSVGNTRLLDLECALRRTGGHGKWVRQLQTATTTHKDLYAYSCKQNVLLLQITILIHNSKTFWKGNVRVTIWNTRNNWDRALLTYEMKTKNKYLSHLYHQENVWKQRSTRNRYWLR
jgi:hypothetical protein